MRVGCLLFLLLSGLAAQTDGLVQRFPMEAYRRLGDPWLEARGTERLLPEAVQAHKARDFRTRLLAPWDRAPELLTDAVSALEARRVAGLEAEVAEEAGFGPNFLPYDTAWLDQLKGKLPAEAGPGRRGITVEHALLRLLPTADVYLYSHTLAGQGYPFDQLQNSVLWAGTPVWVAGETSDKAWCKVVTDGAAGWVPARTVALAGPRFRRQWRRALARNGLAAAINTDAPLLDRRGRNRGSVYVGSVLPRWPGPGPGLGVLVPLRDAVTQRARSVQAFLAAGDAVGQPWPYTPAHAARLWKALLGRPYGWGNLGLNNDCSSELKHFFTPFGLWLPRHSADQARCGRRVDLSVLDGPGRLKVLAEEGRPYLTLLWIPGHVMLYLGPVPGGFMTYQNLWALRPREGPDYRSIVGGSVLFPVLDTYPEAPGLWSLAARPKLTATRLDEEEEAAPDGASRPGPASGSPPGAGPRPPTGSPRPAGSR